MKNFILTAAAAAAVLSMAAATAAKAEGAKMEPCYGVVKAGKNDCRTSGHACAGKSTTNGGADFIDLPAGLCAKLVGGSTTEPKAK